MGSILIVDDDDSFASALGRIITELGHTFERAVDGEEGLEKYADSAFDVVIADLKMPRMNGMEFLREVRKVDRDAVVMVITGYADMSSAVETLTLGAYDYIEKPVSVEKFRAALDRGLEKKKHISQIHFAKGMMWMVVLSIPLWIIISIFLARLWQH